MTTSAQNIRITTLVILAAALGACQTISMPKVDLLKSPEFAEEAANFAKEKDYPEVKDAPLAPSDIRSDKQWDKDVRALQALRDKDDRIEMESGLTDRQAAREYEKLKAKAQAYKKDDPRSGPTVQDFPKFKSRR